MRFVAPVLLPFPLPFLALCFLCGGDAPFVFHTLLRVFFSVLSVGNVMQHGRERGGGGRGGARSPSLPSPSPPLVHDPAAGSGACRVGSDETPTTKRA